MTIAAGMACLTLRFNATIVGDDDTWPKVGTDQASPTVALVPSRKCIWLRSRSPSRSSGTRQTRKYPDLSGKLGSFVNASRWAHCRRNQTIVHLSRNGPRSSGPGCDPRGALGR